MGALSTPDGGQELCPPSGVLPGSPGARGALTCPASLPIFFSFTPLGSWPPQAADPHIETPGPLCRGSGWGICSLLSPKSWFCLQTEKPILSPAHQQWGGAKAFPAQAHAAIPLVTSGPSPGERDAKHGLMCTEASPKSYSQEQSPRQFTPAQGTSLVGTICFLVSAIKTGQAPRALWGQHCQSAGGETGLQHAWP